MTAPSAAAPSPAPPRHAAMQIGLEANGSHGQVASSTVAGALIRIDDGARLVRLAGSGTASGQHLVSVLSRSSAEAGSGSGRCDAIALLGSAQPLDCEYGLMPQRSATETLAPDDFRRLGLRPREARPRVIRKAALRRARPLVRPYLAERSPQAEADLVQLVTLAYRLLDPRNRSSQPERVLLAQMESVPKVPHLWTHPGAGNAGADDTAADDAVADRPAALDLPERPQRWQRFRQWVHQRRPIAALGLGTAMLLAMRIRGAIGVDQREPAAVQAPPVAAQRSQPPCRQRWRT